MPEHDERAVGCLLPIDAERLGLLDRAERELDPFQHRLFVHYLRRADPDLAESIRAAAAACKMSIPTVRKVRQELVELGYIETRAGQPVVVTVLGLERVQDITHVATESGEGVQDIAHEPEKPGEGVQDITHGDDGDVQDIAHAAAESGTGVQKMTHDAPAGVQNIAHDLARAESPDSTESESLKDSQDKDTDKDQVPHSATPGVAARASPPPPPGDSPERPRNPWYDAVYDIWGYVAQLNGAMQNMLRGQSRAAGFKAGNVSVELIPADVRAWAAWYRQTALHGDMTLNMLEDRMKIASSIARWDASGRPTVDRPPEPAATVTRPQLFRKQPPIRKAATT